MAIYRFSLKHGSRAKGKSGAAHACYILRTERYDYGAHELRHSESGNMPHWATSAKHFWESADANERLNAQVYLEFEISLPRELTLQQQIHLVREFICFELTERHPYTMAIHEVPAMDGGQNPHAHVMFTTRMMDGIKRDEAQFFKRANSKHPEKGGAKKDRRWKPTERLIELRQSWERHANQALKQAGYETVIDCRSLQEREIGRSPEPKLTPYEAMLWKQGVLSERVEEILILREIAALKSQQERNERTLVTLQEIANLRDFEARVREVLTNQQKSLDSTLSDRDRVDRRLERLNEQLYHAPGSKIDAYEMARDRIYGGALSAHVEMINGLRRERDELARELEAYGVGGVLQDIPHTVKELRELWAVQQALNHAKETYRRLVKEMQSPEGKRECERFGTELYNVKTQAETERNALFKEAFSIRAEIEEFEYLIPKTEAMLRTARLEMEEAASNLSPALLAWIAPEEIQIAVGQAAVVREDAAKEAKGQRQALKLNLSLKLSLGADEV
ncbi:MAG: MobA/MobL family protein [Leptolyngbya sp. SIO3F4]|nr:MobA/MobL family protein [Leptolyngbya sp. SIO3F4]